MSKTPDKPAAPAETEAQPRVSVHLDDSKCMALYANFCRVTSTPEELIIDFGLNPQPMGALAGTIQLTQRIVTNFYTAKRLLQALHMAVARHEETFGQLEVDVQRRVLPARRQPEAHS